MFARRLLARPTSSRLSILRPPPSRPVTMIHPSTPTSTLPTDSSPPLFRDPNRPLPTLSSISHRRRWLTTLPIFFAVLIASAAGIFNYQKVNSPIIAATLYALRTNTTVREVLGDEVYFASKWAWVWGSINLVHGKVDVRFGVKGTRGRGMCRFRARRVGGRGGMFKTLEWSLTTDDDGRVIQLLDNEGRDPLQGTATSGSMGQS